MEYLLGHKCIVFTNKNPLSYLTLMKLGAVEQHWAAQLAAYNFEIKYRSGKSNLNDDALSQQNLLVVEDIQDSSPGAAVPVVLQQATQGGMVTQVNQIT